MHLIYDRLAFEKIKCFDLVMRHPHRYLTSVEWRHSNCQNTTTI